MVNACRKVENEIHKENIRNSCQLQTVTFTFKVTQPKFLYNVLEIYSHVFGSLSLVMHGSIVAWFQHSNQK